MSPALPRMATARPQLSHHQRRLFPRSRTAPGHNGQQSEGATAMSTAADFLMGSAGPSAKFPAIGTTIGGPITRIGEPMQQKDMATGQPKFWPDGNPMLQLPVDVATDIRDAEINNDDGTRTFYVKGQMQAAIRDAIRRAGAKMLEVGGTLTVTYVRDEQPKQRGFNPAKVYEATYTAPATVAAAQFLGADTPDTNGTPTPAAPTAVAPGTAITPEVAALLQQLQNQQQQAATG